MTLRILEPGLCTLLVDFGRPRTRSLGVPLGGAADRTSLALGNALVGNPPDAAALEIALAGPTIRAEDDTACVVYGANFDLRIGERLINPGTTFTLNPNEVLRIGGAAGHGIRAYFCVQGGLLTHAILGSHSGFSPLPRGADLACRPGKIASRFIPELPQPAALARVVPLVSAAGCEIQEGMSPDFPIRVLPGAQSNWFPAECFVDQPFRVTPQSNRMGLRLDGPRPPVPNRELVSEPVCPGAVQVTRDGRCIVLGVDGQTIGGYPKIAQVITADLDRLGQLRPGESIVFHPVTLEEAEDIHCRKQAELKKWLTRLAAAEIFVRLDAAQKHR